MKEGEYEGLMVSVRRDSSNGRFYSQVERVPATARYHHRIVVIDRQKGRHLDSDTVISRAVSLALLIQAPLLIDKAWRCAAHRLSSCKCPRCQGAPDVPYVPEPDLMRVTEQSGERIIEPWDKEGT